MDIEAYTTVKKAAEQTFVRAWAAYCDSPSLETLEYVENLQYRLQQAAVHAQQLNFRAAVNSLPPLPLTQLAITAQTEGD